jgi:hypothetical protein
MVQVKHICVKITHLICVLCCHMCFMMLCVTIMKTFTRGQTVRCIRPDHNRLTVGKYYIIMETWNNGLVSVIDDNGILWDFDSELFEPVEEH